MLATPAVSPPEGDGWSHEVKWDGMRILADVHAGAVRLTTRTGATATDRFPELTGAGGHAGLRDVHPDVLLDGEVVSLEAGLPSFTRLLERIHAGGSVALRAAETRPVTYMVFDVLRLDGHDLTRLPLHDRRALLESLEIGGPRALVPPVYPDGAALLRATREQGLEGIVSKRLDSAYQPGQRSPHWRKIAHRPTSSVVVGGWRPESTSGAGLGSLLVGLPSADTAGAWRFAGRVGSGIGPAQAKVLLPLLARIAADDSPFRDPVPTADAAGAHWVRPELIIDVRSLGDAGRQRGLAGRRTRRGGADDRLRQPSYLGLRTDLSPTDLTELTDG